MGSTPNIAKIWYNHRNVAQRLVSVVGGDVCGFKSDQIREFDYFERMDHGCRLAELTLTT